MFASLRSMTYKCCLYPHSLIVDTPYCKYSLVQVSEIRNSLVFNYCIEIWKYRSNVWNNNSLILPWRNNVKTFNASHIFTPRQNIKLPNLLYRQLALTCHKLPGRRSRCSVFFLRWSSFSWIPCHLFHLRAFYYGRLNLSHQRNYWWN